MIDAKRYLSAANNYRNCTFDKFKEIAYNCRLDCAETSLIIVDGRINYVKERVGV